MFRFAPRLCRLRSTNLGIGAAINANLNPFASLSSDVCCAASGNFTNRENASVSGPDSAEMLPVRQKRIVRACGHADSKFSAVLLNYLLQADQTMPQAFKREIIPDKFSVRQNPVHAHPDEPFHQHRIVDRPSPDETEAMIADAHGARLVERPINFKNAPGTC